MTGLARAAEKNAAGTWKWERTWGNGEKIEWTLRLKQDGEKLSGTCAFPGGAMEEIKEGMIRDGELSFMLEREINGNLYKADYTGKLEGDKIKGKMEVQGKGGEKQTRDWEAKRAPE
jgi:hypothetical protein